MVFGDIRFPSLELRGWDRSIINVIVKLNVFFWTLLLFEALTSGVGRLLRVQPRSKIGNTRIGTVVTGVMVTSGPRVQSVVVEEEGANLPTTPRRI